MNLDKLVISTETDIEKEELNKLILSLSEEDKNGIHILPDDAIVGKDPIEYLKLKRTEKRNLKHYF